MGRIFERAEQYLDQIDPGMYLEIGTSRNGDDGSTKILSEWATKRNCKLTTVDMDPVNCDLVKYWNLLNTTVINSSGEHFLKQSSFPSNTISFLYLDNFDWDWHPEKTEAFVLDQQARYRTFGLEMNNINSQCAHLAQMAIALPSMTYKSLVVCDDTWYNKFWGHYSGKCGAVVPFLLNAGYRVLDTEESPVYGTILGRGI